MAQGSSKRWEWIVEVLLHVALGSLGFPSCKCFSSLLMIGRLDGHYIYIYILDRCGRTLCPGPQWFSDSGTPGTLTLYAGIGSGPYVSNRFQVDREQWMGRAERLLVAFGRLQCMLVTCATDLT